MTRKNIAPKPLFDVKHDFVETLDHFIHTVIVLRQTVQHAIDLDLVQEPAKSMLNKRLTALAEAMDSDPE